MWAALQRRFNDQNRPGCARELLARGLKVFPIDGQTSSVTWSLGFKETGSCSRTASLSRDFQSLASMVDAEQACYLVVFVGDLHGGSLGTVATASSDAAKWILISFVPESTTASLAKKMADNRAGLKAGLGAEHFCGDMWCSSRDQITLSHYIKTLEVAPDLEAAERATIIQAAYRGKQSRRGSAELRQTREKSALAIQRRQRRKSNPDVAVAGGGGGSEGIALSDANDEVWAERIKGIKAAYVDSCTRLGSALEELEQTLCLLTGDDYRAIV